MVGNGVTNWKYDCTPAYFHMAYYHGLISDDLFNNVNANCDLSYIDSPNPPPLSEQCTAWVNKFNDLVSLVNIYDIFGKCWKNPTAVKARLESKYKQVSDVPEAGMTAAKYTPFLGAPKHAMLKEVPPCVYAKPIIDYFNNDTIKAALHISEKAEKWDLCRAAPEFDYTSS